MNANIRIFLFCPIPENQKPIKELILLQENSLYHWINFSNKKYTKTLFSIIFFFYAAIILFLLPIFSFHISFFFFLFTLFFLIFFLFIFFLLIFFRWSQLERKLKIARLFYEEGSWYDGQIWEKPLSLIKNERLLTSQKIQPNLQRFSFPLIFLLFLLIILFFLLLFSHL